MPNGDDKNWIRLCGAIDGFRVRYDRWPTRIRINRMMFEDLRDHVLPRKAFAQLQRQLEFIVEDEMLMAAEDDTGAIYDYSREGFPESRPDPDARTWLGDPDLNLDLGY